MKIILITGGRDSGKTSFLRFLTNEPGTAGCLALKVFSEEGFIGYDLSLVPGTISIPLARKIETEKPEKIVRGESGIPGNNYLSFGSYLFNRDHFEKTYHYLSGRFHVPQYNRWFLDEIGPLEMADEGLAPLLQYFLEKGNREEIDRELYLTVRLSLVNAIQEKFRFSASQTIRLCL